MSESFKSQSQKPRGPWHVEPGSPVDALERRHAFERGTIADMVSSLRTFAKSEGFTYDIEDVEGGQDIQVPPECLAATLGHLKPLLKDANALLEQHNQQFRVRVHLHGTLLELRVVSHS
ncbi:MAG: hypothetical protein RLZZ234_432 [Candidatus Parcubacteria bacterium]|jgi:hypothetical protein